MAEAFGEVAPGGSGLGDPEHGVDEEAVILGVDPGLAGLTRQEVSDPLPVFILDLMTSHGGSSTRSSRRNSLPVLLNASMFCPHDLVYEFIKQANLGRHACKHGIGPMGSWTSCPAKQ
jgi:hypothetical protein